MNLRHYPRQYKSGCLRSNLNILFNYGVDWKDLIGQDPEYIRAEMKRMIQETLEKDDRIKSVENFKFEFSGTICRCSFDVISIFGKTREVVKADV